MPDSPFEINESGEIIRLGGETKREKLAELLRAGERVVLNDLFDRNNVQKQETNMKDVLSEKKKKFFGKKHSVDIFAKIKQYKNQKE